MNIDQQLTKEQRTIVGRAYQLAEELNTPIYLVGGAVRDLLLKRKIKDLDIGVEGNGPRLAQGLNSHLQGNLKVFDNFLTSTISLASGTEVDIITSRKEHYPSWGVLPQVEPGNIRDDLLRRDFTINALAIRLASTKGGELLDPTGGYYDLKHKKLRVLHKQSFLEDPTRIIRAIRFKERLSFSLEGVTRSLLIKAREQLGGVSPNRLKGEYIKIIQEGKTVKILRELATYQVLHYVLPGVNPRQIAVKSVDYLKDQHRLEGGFNLALALLMLIYWQGAQDLAQIQKIQWDLTKKERKALEWLVATRREINFLLNYPSHVSQIHLHRIFYNSPPEAKFLILTLLINGRGELITRIKDLHGAVKLPLTGQDLLENGILPGPRLGQLLANLEEEVLLGKISCKKEALDWLRRVKSDVN